MTKQSTTHILVCTNDQLKLIYELLRPSFDDDSLTLVDTLADSIMKADYHDSGLFLSKYECSQYYGGPEEGGWWGWHNELCWSEYYGFDVYELLEHLNQHLIEDDAMPDVFEAIPKKEQILNYMMAEEDYPGEMSQRSMGVAKVEEPDAHSYDSYICYVVEFQPGGQQTTKKEVYQ